MRLFRVVMLISIYCFSISLLKASSVEHKIVITSIPKCGTHLLTKVICMLTQKDYKLISWDDKTLQNYLKHDDYGILCSHFFYSDKTEKILEQANALCFFIYRDPRDQIISYVNWELKERPEEYSGSFDELITQFIEGRNGYHHQNHLHNKNVKGISNFYSTYLPWKDSSLFCAIKFEDLIGPQGGGSEQKQLICLKKISDHLRIHVTEEMLREIAKESFGGTWTFKSGKIGRWKHTFLQEHVDRIKVIAGRLLIDLGYEEDFNW